MEIDDQYPEKREIYLKIVLNFYFLNVDTSITMQDLIFKFYMCIKYNTVRRTTSQIFYIGPGHFLWNLEKNI